jgi:FdhD protein
MKAGDKRPSVVEGLKIKRLREDGSSVELEQGVITEEPLQVCLNGEPYATIMRTPGQEKELALGFCFTEGIISGLSQIRLVEHCGSGTDADNSANVVNIVLNQPLDLSPPRRNLEVRSACAVCGLTTIDELTRCLTPIRSSLRLPARALRQMAGKMEEEQKLYAATGTTHAAALFDETGRLVICAEDIGRHNALDKAIGYTLLHEVPRHNLTAILSGRASFEMLVKVIRARIPLVASVSGTTRLSVELARRLGCTLIGYLRDGRMEIYTHAERVGEG